MRMDDMILVSVDDHVVEPPDLFKNHLTAEYQAQAPSITRHSSGCDVWEFNGQKLPNIGLNAVLGRAPEETGMEPTSYDPLRKGCYDVHALRAEAQDVDLSMMQGGGGTAAHKEGGRIVTASDIMAQLADAFVER